MFCAVPTHTHPFPFLFIGSGIIGLVGDTLHEGEEIVRDTLGLEDGFRDDHR
jgi:hypothetical protein